MIKICIAITLLACFNAYTASRVFCRCSWANQHATTAWIIAALFFVLQLMGVFGNHYIFPVLKKYFDLSVIIPVLNYISYLSLGLLSSLMIYVIAVDVLSVIWKITGMPSIPFCTDRRIFLSLGGVTISTLALGIKQAKAGPAVKEIEIKLQNLPPQFDGFKIVQISDMHVGPIIDRKYVKNAVQIANSLKPDLFALTGDFVDGSVENLREDVAYLSQLSAPHGIFFVTGNHEYYWDAPGWTSEFEKMGIHVLSNRHVMISRNEEKIVLAGVTDHSTLRMRLGEASNPEKSLEGSPTGCTKILLAHQPASYELAHKAGFDLQLSGHTHAGQYFPCNLFIGLFQRYYKGLNRHEGMFVYVNSGTGYWGPPLRTGVPSEITLITLRAGVLF